MPQIVKTVDDIMAQEQRDMFFLDLGGPFREHDLDDDAEREHLLWFASHGLRYAPAAPPGWLEGDAGLYVVYFSSAADPRVAAYTARFETPEGISLDPDAYQMKLVTYESWVHSGGPGRLAGEP